MAWNKASEAPKVAPKKSPSKMRGVIAGVVVVILGAGIAVWLIWPDAKPPRASSTSTSTSLIKEVAPAVTNVPVRELTKEEKRKKEIEEIERLYAGKEMPRGVATHLYYLKNPPKISMKAKATHDYFRHQSERVIAGTVMVMPGTFFLTQPKYGENFDIDFKNALNDEIEINDNDSEEIRAKKKEMIELKKEIAKICKEEGKKPSEVINEHAAAMYELSRYKALLDQQLREIRDNPDMTDNDVRDAFAAANEMLASKGIDPVRIPNLTSRAVRLRKNAERAERKAKQDSNKNSHKAK